MIINDYNPGGYTRKELKGYLQYLRYEYAELKIDKSKGNNLVFSSEIEEMFENGIIDKNQKNYYIIKISDFFNDFESFDKFSDEEIYYSFSKFKENIYLKEMKSFLMSKKAVLLEKAKKECEKLNDIKKLIKKMIHYDTVEENIVIKDKFYEIENLIKDIHNTDSLNIIFGNYLQTPFLEKFIEYFKDKKIKLFLKNERVYDEPLFDEFIQKDNIVKIKYVSKNAGINIREIESEIKKGLILVFDEVSLINFNGLMNQDYYVLSKIKDLKTQRYVGVYNLNTKKVNTILKKIRKSGKTIFSGVERTYNTIYPFKKEGYYNQYSETFDYNNFSEIQVDNNENIFLTKEKFVERVILNYLKEKKVNYINSYYSLENYEKTNYIPNKDYDGVLVKGIYIKDVSSYEITPIIAQNKNKDLINIREEVDKDGFYINFLYFATPKIISLYNSFRNDKEHLKEKDFYIDYFFDGKNETFPLYNKGAVLFTKDNKIEFERIKAESGEISIGGYRINFDKKNINNEKASVNIITPLSAEKNEQKFRYYTLKKGKDRFNIVIANNKIVTIKFSTVQIPSLGFVISLNKEEFKKFSKIVTLKKTKEYYEPLESFQINIKINRDKNYKYIYGGGTLLFKNGVNLVENEEKTLKNFEEEGWYNPLSMQTQETQVQEWVRGPRAIIGNDDKNGFFVLTFSGRTKESKGVRFDEIIKITEKEIKNIKNIMNLDGGASVCFGLMYKKEFFEVSYPCTSNYTSAGMVRPVNSMLLIRK